MVFMKYLSIAMPKLVQNAYNLWRFGIFDVLNMLISILRPKLVQKLKVPRIEIEILKFGTFGISNMSISILMLKIIFMKYLLPVMLKLVQELKIHRVH